ncbi:hypothetical protein R3P38DRAFT_3522302 [Favolaschia claudopus]|uniref:Chromo domain-containing protein n=1 Tax=Favolaschia claudopus TaxID=2862362 RepID=A0AAW0E406_9AGAR
MSSLRRVSFEGVQDESELQPSIVDNLSLITGSTILTSFTKAEARGTLQKSIAGNHHLLLRVPPRQLMQLRVPQFKFPVPASSAQAPVASSSRLISECVVPTTSNEDGFPPSIEPVSEPSSLPESVTPASSLENPDAAPQHANENSFEVESIVDIDKTGGRRLMKPLWRVRWKGYGPEHDQWNSYAQLQVLGRRVQQTNNYLLPDLISFSRSPSPFSSASPSPSIKRKQLPESDEDDVSDAPGSSAAVALQLEMLGVLEKLFTPELRQAELDSLLASEESIQRTKRYFAPTTTTSMVEMLFAQNELRSQFNDYMSFVPRSSSGSKWTQHSAVLSLERVVQAVAVLPDLIVNETKTTILDRSLRWEIARSYLLLYSWYQETDPKLANTLVELHKSGHWTEEGGYPVVQRCHPAFAPLVHYIVSYVACQSWSKHQTKKAKRRQPGSAPRDRSFPHPKCPFPIPDEQLRSLPYDLHGLRLGEGKTKRIMLNLPKGHKGLQNVDAIYECSAIILQAVWSSELILPPVLKMEQALPQPARRKSDPDLVKRRAVGRGAVLQCIVDACGSDESILASSDIEGILAAPWRMFSPHLEKESRFAPAVLRDPQRTLAPLSDWLAERLDAHPSILDFAAQSARFVHRGLLELHYGVALNDEHYLNPNLLYDEGEDALFVVPEALNKQRRATRKKTALYQPPTKDSLLPKAGTPHLGAIALLLRERCNELRKFPKADSILHNVLMAVILIRVASSSTETKTDPARQFSNYAQLLQCSLPPSKLTEPLGISRLLAYMGTGQGNKTSAFLQNGLDPKTANFLWLSTIFRTGSRAASLAGYRQTFNACIRGQASNHLSLQPTMGKGDRKRKYTLEEKFTPYFSERVQKLWCGFLGDLVGKNPGSQAELGGFPPFRLDYGTRAADAARDVLESEGDGCEYVGSDLEEEFPLDEAEFGAHLQADTPVTPGPIILPTESLPSASISSIDQSLAQSRAHERKLDYHKNR